MATHNGTKSIVLALRENELCKRLKDPKNRNVYHLEAFLSFEEAIKLDRGNANVRPPSARKKAYKDMLDTVKDTPASFHVKNRGVIYFCDEFEFDNNKKTLTVTVPDLPNGLADDDDAPRYGIADGGHTFHVIQDTLKRQEELEAENEDWAMPFVRVHFTSGARHEIAADEEIVEAVNTSSQVQQYTLDEYANKFDELKEALARNGFDTDLIAFTENEDKPWSVVEIIQRMACFLQERWLSTQPASIYKSKAKALNLYTNEETRREFQALYDVIVDVITFPEFIQSQLSTGGLVQPRSFGRLRAVKPLQKPWKRPGTPYETRHKIDLAAVLPMAGAFRELLKRKGDRYVWRVDPKETFRQCAPQLHNVLVKHSAKVKAPSQLGSDMEYWSTCVPVVMRQMQEMLDPSRVVALAE